MAKHLTQKGYSHLTIFFECGTRGIKDCFLSRIAEKKEELEVQFCYYERINPKYLTISGDELAKMTEVKNILENE